MENYLLEIKYLDKNMKFSISLRIDSEGQHKSFIIHDLSQILSAYFKDKDYGTDICDFLIGIICVKVPHGLEKLFEPKKISYVDFKVIKNKFTGESITLNKQLSFDIKMNLIDYDSFVSLNDEDSKRLIAKMILDSISNFEFLPKKVKNFNKEKYVEDLKYFFAENNLIK